MVVVRSGGVFLVRLVPPPPWDAGARSELPLSLAGVRFLAHLSLHPVDVEEAAHISGMDATTTEAFLAELATFGLTGPPEDLHRAAPPPAGQPQVDPGPHDPSADDRLLLRLPLVLHVANGGFEAFDHDGARLLRLSPDALWTLQAFTTPRTVDEAEAAVGELLDDDVDRSLLRVLTGELLEAGVLAPVEPDWTAPVNTDIEYYRAALRAEAAFRRHVLDLHASHDADERERRSRTGVRRVPVVPVSVNGNVPPLSTGMVIAYAQSVDGGRLSDTFDLYPRWLTHTADIQPSPDPAIYLFTNYIWSHDSNLTFAAEVKEASPGAVTIFGGPDCPTYPRDAERYLRHHPQVDVIVRGEGEATFAELLAALAPAAGTDRLDLGRLAEVPGLVFRSGDGEMRTTDRDRITDVDSIPSPYLEGIFQAYGDTGSLAMVVVETNRGCPYSCTFCDWGSATNSRIRKFDLDRVLAELTWCAEHQVTSIFLADANFGIFARDVEITRHLVDLKERYGFPKRLITNYAKNTVKHLREIVELLVAGDVVSEGLLSLQSMDDDTLRAVRRSNIKTEKYEELAREFRSSRLPLFVDLMMGLPGQTVTSLKADLQQCVDREVNAKVHATELLVNSPMNEPTYREEHRLLSVRPPGPASNRSANGPALVVSTSTFTEDEYLEMDRIRRTYLLAENLGVLRQVSRFVRRELGMKEVDLIDLVRTQVSRQPEQWPFLALALVAVPQAMVPPVSWKLAFGELRSLLTSELPLPDDDALDTVLAVQRALLPAPGREFPETLQLPHDYAAWYRCVQEAKDAGHFEDWEEMVPRLAELGPGTFTVDDPTALSRRVLGLGSALMPYKDWELDSPVARAMPANHRLG